MEALGQVGVMEALGRAGGVEILGPVASMEAPGRRAAWRRAEHRRGGARPAGDGLGVRPGGRVGVVRRRAEFGRRRVGWDADSTGYGLGIFILFVVRWWWVARGASIFCTEKGATSAKQILGRQNWHVFNPKLSFKCTYVKEKIVKFTENYR